MRRVVAWLFVLVAVPLVSVAQPVAVPRSNVVAYDDDGAVEKLAYRESPYYMELTGSWKQRRTDSSVVYSRQVEVDRVWKDYLVFLNVRCGRACRVYINDKEVGYAEDSRNWNEFQLNKYLKYGKFNTLAIEALKHPQGALLEDTAITVGLNGEPYILFKSDPGVCDMGLSADYDALTLSGTLTVDASVFNSRHKGRYYVEVEVWDPQGRQLDRMGRWVVFDKRTEEQVDISRTWSDIEPWSAESPSLYTVVVRLRNEEMEEEETVGARVGFRRVEIKDGLLLVNGKPITIKGVNYGIEHTEGYASREQMRRDIIAMKRNNINAVRTARFSPMDAFFYELCDSYGLYVVADANLMPVSSQHQAVATDQTYAPLFERRVENLYGKYRNYTSIIAWCLGDTRDNGVCMAAAYRRLKALEKQRPVVFPGADFSEVTDIIAPALPSVNTMKQALSKSGDRPFLMLPSVNKTNFADLGDLWGIVQSQRQLQGGFVASWPIGGVLLAELKQLYSPFSVALSKITPDDAEFVVHNSNDFTSFGVYSLEYTIYTNLRSNVVAGDLPVAMGGGESDKVSMRIPDLDLQAGEELFIRFDVSRRRNRKLEWVGNSPSELAVGSVVFSLPAHGAPRSLLDSSGTTIDSTLLCDSTLIAPVLAFEGHTDWRANTVAVARRQPDSHTLCVDAMLQYTAPTGAPMCDVRLSYTVHGTGDIVADYIISPTDRVRGAMAPEFIVIPTLGDTDTMRWFGSGRETLFRHSNTVVGVYEKPVTAVSGSRGEVRWCAVGGSEGLFCQLVDTLCIFSVDDGALRIKPQRPMRHVRLHIAPYNQNRTPEECYAVRCPVVASGILEPPQISASATRFSQPLTVKLSTKADNQTIRYTLDGSEPTEVSALYTAPLTITSTTVVKARAFVKGMPPSFTATRKFNYDYIVRTGFSRKANTPYNVGVDTILYDGERGSVDDLSRGWLGFSGTAPVVNVELAKAVDIDYLVLRYAHSPAVWAFAPREVIIVFSANGNEWGDTVHYTIPFDPAAQENAADQLVELRIPVERKGIGYIKIEAETMDKIPGWHRAKGLKPWLLMDEIEVSEQISNDK